MRTRAPFLLRGNFQFTFLLGLAALAALGILAASVFNYVALERILEGAAFSAHLSVASSGELVWRAILEVTLLCAGVSLFVGCAVIVVALWYLEELFRALAEGLQRLARGECVFRLAMGGKRWGRQLIDEFNDAAAALDRRAGELRGSLDGLIAAIGSDQPGWLDDTKAIQGQLRQSRRL